jgi:hypothetical protein
MHSRSECPICRAPLRPEDLFDAATEEEVAAQRLQSEHTGNYGAKARHLGALALDYVVFAAPVPLMLAPGWALLETPPLLSQHNKVPTQSGPRTLLLPACVAAPWHSVLLDV